MLGWEGYKILALSRAGDYENVVCGVKTSLRAALCVNDEYESVAFLKAHEIIDLFSFL